MQSRWLLRLAVFLLALAPSAQYAWRNRDMPYFARRHDDGLLFLSAKSLAAGQGYRSPSLPEDPYQTKYPVLYPLYLSAVWQLNPEFPGNLPLATAFSWATLAACLALAWALYRRDGFTERRTWLMVGLLGVCPYMIMFGTWLFSEIFFTCFLLLTLLAARFDDSERHAARMAAVAGVLAGCAYLSRTAGIALLISMPAWYLLRRQTRSAIAFAGAMLPFVAGWSWWTRVHMLASSDPGLIYYVDYVRFQFMNVGWDNLGVTLWKNLDQLLYSFGSLAIPQVVAIGPVKILTQVIGIAAISGVIRLAQRQIALDYALFALVSVAMLLVWHYPPNERFVLPLFPLLVAGLTAEIDFLVGALRTGFRHREAGQRVAAYVLASMAALVCAAGLGLQMFVSLGYLNQMADRERTKLRDFRAAYRWINANLPANASILSNDDPLLYAYTGRRGNCLPLLPRWWYGDDHQRIVDAFRDVAPYCRSRRFDYFYATSDDLARWTGAEDQAKVDKVVRSNPELIPVFSSGIGTLYKISPRASADHRPADLD
jgi:hypothetical protein